MSSKRGRKRNDNLPPNRARDVQRAFRARRAAHLLAMEERVAELTEENDLLRARLNMPPASRSPLGKGPTGKDKPREWPPRSVEPPGTNGASISRATSSASSTRGSSISPGASAGLQPSPPMGDAQWSEMLADGPNDAKAGSSSAPPSSSAALPPPSAVSTSFAQHAQSTNSFGSPVNSSFAQGSANSGAFSPTASSSAFSLNSVSAPNAQKAQPQQSQYSYSPHLPTTQRPSLAGTVFMQSMPGQNYGHSAFLDNTGSYQASPISPHDAGGQLHHHSSGPSSLHSLVHPSTTSQPFNTRRSIADSHTYRALGNHHGYLASAAAGTHRTGSGDSRLHPVQ